jgi:NNP family nitrate/nitrite transporter-like MFS transporter
MVSGIVGAGGNLGGMAFGFLFKVESISYVQAFQYIGYIIILVSIIILITKFSTEKTQAVDAKDLSLKPLK